MYSHERRRLPISTRHAFALGFDLALRRDPLHSLLVPVLLRAPWGLAIILMPIGDAAEMHPGQMGIAMLALMGDFITTLIVGAMLRLRARSVFNTPRGVRPAPVGDCYALGIRRVPWLLATEVARNLLLTAAASLIILPTAFFRFAPESALFDMGRNLVLLAIAFLMALPFFSLAYRLAVATEAVVLMEHDLGGAFQSSFRIMRGHFERWLELVLAGGTLLLAPALGIAALSLVVPALAETPGRILLGVLALGMWSILQYAWTFFFLRLVEIESPPVVEPAPMYAAETVAMSTATQADPRGRVEPSPLPGVSETNASAAP